jgi:hypothetical protein
MLVVKLLVTNLRILVGDKSNNSLVPLDYTHEGIKSNLKSKQQQNKSRQLSAVREDVFCRWIRFPAVKQVLTMGKKS